MDKITREQYIKLVKPLTRIDKEGIPKIVQHVKFCLSGFYFEIKFFNDSKMRVEPNYLLSAYPPNIVDGISEEQMLDAWIIADRYDKKLWDMHNNDRQ